MEQLRVFAQNAHRLVAKGYYKARPPHRVPRSPPISEALIKAQGNGLIAEVKLRAPQAGTLRKRSELEPLLDAYVAGGAMAVSVLTEPRFFGGRLEDLALAASRGLPVLMKDFVVDPAQIEAAARWGASCVLLIQRLFDAGLTDASLDRCVQAAHGIGLETLLEVHTVEELQRALETRTDLLGINQRDLDSLQLRRGRAEAILARSERIRRPIIAMSGVGTPATVRRLRAAGASGILIGTALVRHRQPAQLLARLREAAGG